MDRKMLICPSCGQLAAQMKEASGGSYRQYDQLLQKLMELERQGDMELYAGDCPLEDTSAVLDAEQHYTVCHYMRCRSCGTPYFVGACIRGAPVFRQVADIRKENLNIRLWGRCEPATYRKKTEGGVNMDVVKLPKKVRMVCYEVMDGKEGAFDTLESFSDKYPHQVAAVKAEVAYFNLDYEKALALDLTILPYDGGCHPAPPGTGADGGADEGTGTHPGRGWPPPAGSFL